MYIMYLHVLGFVNEKRIIRNVLKIVFSMVSEMYSETYFLVRVNVYNLFACSWLCKPETFYPKCIENCIFHCLRNVF